MQSTGVPAGWYGAPAAQPMTVPGLGYRALAVSRWRRLTVALGIVSLAVAFGFEIAATVMAIGARSVVSDESWLYLWSWLYKPLEITFSDSAVTHQLYIGYPPLLLGIALVASLTFVFWVAVRPDAALKKAGARGAKIWSSREDKARWYDALGRLRWSGVALFRTSYRVFLLLAAISSAGVAALGAVAIVSRQSVSTTGVPLSQLSVGLGPWVCLVAGSIAALAFVLAMLGHDRKVLVQADGSVLDLTAYPS
jgi:hypothetical protein